MKQLQIALTICLFLSLAGCGPSSKTIDELVRYGELNVPVVQQFYEAFPESTSHIAYFGGIGSDLSWVSVAVYKGRYLVKMGFKIQVNGKTMTKVNDASFSIMEVTSMSDIGSGRHMTFSDRQMSFGEAEWDEVFKNNMDFMKISYEFGSTEPIEGLFEAESTALQIR